MNNSNQNPKDISNFAMKEDKEFGFAMRYLVQGREEPWNQSWVSESKTRKVWDTPKLQFTLDGVEWTDVLTVYVEE